MKFEPRPLEETQDISRGRASWLDGLKLVVSAAVLLVTGYVLLGWLAEAVAMSIPDELEARWFVAQIGDAEAEHPRFGEAQALFEELLEDEALRQLPYQLFLLDMPEPNAFAVPGGGVGVTAGLLDTVKTETGLAMVLAHELGHHSKRHVLRGLGRGLLQQSAVALLFGQSGGTELIEVGALMAGRRYSRKAEYEADEFGFRLVQRHFESTEGATEFFEWACREEHRKGDAGGWLRTHPLSRDRIDRMRRLDGGLRACELD